MIVRATLAPLVTPDDSQFDGIVRQSARCQCRMSYFQARRLFVTENILHGGHMYNFEKGFNRHIPILLPHIAWLIVSMRVEESVIRNIVQDLCANE